MYKEKIISVVVPAHNEEKLISRTLSTIPDFIDHIIVINDYSKDSTKKLIEEIMKADNRIKLIDNDVNRGVGYSIKKGYQISNSLGADISVVMAGDAQMNPDEIPRLLNPLISGKADYSKGNRLTKKHIHKMPLFRRFGNSLLTLLNKVSTGYWKVVDPQNGYTAITSSAISKISMEKITDRYGNPNDFLIALNIYNYNVVDVEIPAIYGEEKSGINIFKFIPVTSWLLFSGFFRRIHKKYGGVNFHPILLFYYLGFSSFLVFTLLVSRLFYVWEKTSDIPDLNALAAGIAFVSTAQFLMFALFFDMQTIQDK